MAEDENQWSNALASIVRHTTFMGMLWDTFGKMTIPGFIKEVLPAIESRLGPALREWTDDILRNMGLDASESAKVQDLLAGWGPLRIVLVSFLSLSLVGKRVSTISSSLVEKELYELYSKQGWRKLSPDVLLPILWRKRHNGDSWLEVFYDFAKSIGLSDTAIEALSETAAKVLEPPELARSLIQGYIDLDTYQTTMQERGYIDLDSNRLFELGLQWPDLSSIFELERRQITTPEESEVTMQRLGFKPDLIPKLHELIEINPDLNTIFQLERRQIITAEDAEALITRLGFGKELIPNVHQLQYVIPDMNSVFSMTNRGLITPDGAHTILQGLGFEADAIDPMLQLRHQLLDPDAIKQLYWRKFLSPQDASSRMQQLGFKSEDMPLIEKLWNPVDPYTGNVPPFPDIIRMAVRDVFNPDAVARYGLDVNYPEVVSRYADMTGFGDYWSRAYWRAHWQLPSFQSARNMMFLSDKFDTQDLATLLLYADFPPALIPAMMDAAYNPLTRVDVRRMHKVGTVSDAGLFKAYSRLGFNPENAKAMADFTIAYNADEDKTYTATRVLNAYRDYLIDRGTASGYLAQLGYEASESQTKLSGIDVDMALAEESDAIATIKRRFLTYTLTETETLGELGQRGYSDDRITMLLTEWHNEQARKIRTPTKAHLDQFLRKGLIGADEYLTSLTQMGYSPQNALRYLQLLGD